MPLMERLLPNVMVYFCIWILSSLNSSITFNKEVLEYLSWNKYFQMNELMMDKQIIFHQQKQS